MEIWKQVKGFPQYEVSTYGRVRRPNGQWNGEKRYETYGADHGNGYKKISLWYGHKKFKSVYVHRIVAETFIPNPNNKPCVNHIDCNPANNHVENLEWCTKKENSEWMKKLGRNKRTPEWIKHHHDSVIQYQGKAVIGTNLTTKEEKFYRTLNSTKQDGFHPGDVCKVLKGQRKYCKNTTWRYATADEMRQMGLVPPQDEVIQKAIERYERTHK